MSTKPDLRAVCEHGVAGPHSLYKAPDCKGGHRVTPADLVAALIAEGGEIVEARQEERGWRPLMRVQEPGRYLIYLIPKGDKE